MGMRAALGFRFHTGWAALVAAARHGDQIEVLLRRRVELLPADGSIPRFVYHTAAELDGGESAALVSRAAAGSQKIAKAALAEIVAMLRRLDVTLDSAGIPEGSTQVPDDLSRILGSHPMIHAAEGALFQKAVAAACQSCGLQIVTAKEREVFARAANACHSDAARFRESLDGLRKKIGPPWGADQKTATAAALLALHAGASSAPRSGSRGSSKD
jgi:hypothetical protein